ncbi:unnamed protein product [Spodoptera exigua]|uniref:Uncharacterized protein n=1 Tax=Spodoptera exigua TaxID=7107 RepID=A0A922M4G2_SPOEX|nr:hypothetical protein HF086_017480 [Spodoptera exigua]CAH0696469.1 unnamed protein product [Spodoptera exigua]
MAVLISYLFLLGLISYTSGKPADDSLYGIVELLEAISNYEDNPKSQQEDNARIISQDEKIQKYERDRNKENKMAPTVQSIYNLETKADKPLSNINLLVPIRDTLTDCNSVETCKDTKNLLESSRIEDQINNVIEVLSQLDNNVENDGRSTDRVSDGRYYNNQVYKINGNYKKKRMPKIFRISENFDAVMIDADTFERLMSNLNSNTYNEREAEKLLESINLEQLEKDNNRNDKKYNTDAGAYDAENRDDGNALVRVLKELLSKARNE